MVSRQSKTTDSTQLPSIEFEDIISGEGRLNKDISNKLDNRKGILFEPEYILYGKLRPYLKNWFFSDIKGKAIGDFWVFKANNTYPLFIYYLIQAKQFQQVANDTSGTKMPRSDWKLVSNTYFYIPKLSEQMQIANFLKYIDKTITLHQRKLELLKSLKSAYLQQLFPEKGRNMPRLRFNNFNEVWELCKLDETSQIVMGQSPSSKNYTKNPSDFILVQGNADIKEGKVSPRVWTTEITKKAEKGDLILTVRAPVGEVGKTDYDIVLGRGVASINGNEFVYQLLLRMQQSNYWSRFSSGSTFESINSADVKNASFFSPDLKEQDYIGKFLERFDTAITLHHHKLELIKKLKEAYLQKMFI